MESSRITTSRLCSTRRLAFSITISATWTWRAAGSSKVELITSPLTVRCMSVTSSGRSSISSTISVISGMVGGDGVGDVLQQHRLAGARRRHDQAALALADGRQQVEHARRDVVLDGLQPDPLLRVERREVVEKDLVARLVGRLEVDRLHLDQREVALAVLGRADLAGDRCRRCADRTCGSARARRRCRPGRADSCSRARAGSRSRPAGIRARLREKMRPFFSVCACRILKISSCLRMPVAPTTLRSLATWVSVVMFISFSLAMSRTSPSLSSSIFSS